MKIHLSIGLLVCFWALSAVLPSAQPGHSRQTRRPLIQGRHYAVSSMKPGATMAAERVLRAGGNAFDAAVAGQAVLGVVDAELNGIGGDAVLLVYDARSKRVASLNCEGTAPRLATIDWYKANHDGRLPNNDTLLSGTVPGVIDCWYILLDRWGTKSFAELLAPAIELAEEGFPIGQRLAEKSWRRRSS